MIFTLQMPTHEEPFASAISILEVEVCTRKLEKFTICPCFGLVQFPTWLLNIGSFGSCHSYLNPTSDQLVRLFRWSAEFFHSSTSSLVLINSPENWSRRHKSLHISWIVIVLLRYPDRSFHLVFSASVKWFCSCSADGQLINYWKQAKVIGLCNFIYYINHCLG